MFKQKRLSRKRKMMNSDTQLSFLVAQPIKINKTTLNLFQTLIVQNESFKQLVNCEKKEQTSWGDLSVTYARDYIRNDKIGVMFKRHGFSLNYNYTTNSYEQKELRKKFILSATTTLSTITGESEPGPTEFKRPRITTDTVIQQNLQPGPLRFNDFI